MNWQVKDDFMVLKGLQETDYLALTKGQRLPIERPVIVFLSAPLARAIKDSQAFLQMLSEWFGCCHAKIRRECLKLSILGRQLYVECE